LSGDVVVHPDDTRQGHTDERASTNGLAHYKGNDVTNTLGLRTAIVGLIRCAATEDEMLLTSTSDRDDSGSAHQWAPVPTVAHNTQFKREQVTRLQAVLDHEEPPDFALVDHACERTYRAFADIAPQVVADESRQTADDLVDALLLLPEEDLIDPTRHEWLRGRPLWLQIIVRGFWHPMGHVGDWYLANAMPEHSLRLRKQAVATADYVDAPGEARGMAWYSLACTCAALGATDEAVAALEHATALNHDLRARVATDSDLEALREDGRVAALLTRESPDR
jgi:hypothetical protein